MSGLVLKLISVNVARPRVIGYARGLPVHSGIAKRPVAAHTIEVGQTNLAGDAQADLSVHGGLDKAVYAYPAEHWPWWEREHGFACHAGRFGENLTLEGAHETAVRIGDRFAWGETILEVSQPRTPCFKLQIHAGRAEIAGLMTVSGRCGWYFRVIATGAAPTGNATLTRIAWSDGPSVAETFAAMTNPRFDRARRAIISECQALTGSWRDALARHSERTG